MVKCVRDYICSKNKHLLCASLGLWWNINLIRRVVCIKETKKDGGPPRGVVHEWCEFVRMEILGICTRAGSPTVDGKAAEPFCWLRLYEYCSAWNLLVRRPRTSCTKNKSKRVFVVALGVAVCYSNGPSQYVNCVPTNLKFWLWHNISLHSTTDITCMSWTMSTNTLLSSPHFLQYEHILDGLLESQKPQWRVKKRNTAKRYALLLSLPANIISV